MKRFLIALCFLLSFSNSYSQGGGVYIGASAGLGLNGYSSRITTGYEVVVTNSMNLGSSYGFCVGLVTNGGTKMGFSYSFSDNANIYGDIVALKNISFDFATHYEIYNDLYYCPEFNLGGILGAVSSSYDFPIVGLQLQLSILQLEYRPTHHFAISTNLCYGAAYFLKGGDQLLLFEENIFNVSLCSSPLVTFKYYF